MRTWEGIIIDKIADGQIVDGEGIIIDKIGDGQLLIHVHK